MFVYNALKKKMAHREKNQSHFLAFAKRRIMFSTLMGFSSHAVAILHHSFFHSKAIPFYPFDNLNKPAGSRTAYSSPWNPVRLWVPLMAPQITTVCQLPPLTIGSIVLPLDLLDIPYNEVGCVVSQSTPLIAMTSPTARRGIEDGVYDAVHTPLVSTDNAVIHPPETLEFES